MTTTDAFCVERLGTRGVILSPAVRAGWELKLTWLRSATIATSERIPVRIAECAGQG